MRYSIVFATAIALSFATGGCGKKSKKSKPETKNTKPQSDAATVIPPDVVNVTKLAKTMCACKDKACADVVQKKFNAFMAKTQATQATRKAHQTASTELMSCYMGIVKAGTPPANNGTKKATLPYAGHKNMSAAIDASIAALTEIVKATCKCKGPQCRREASMKIIQWRTKYSRIQPGKEKMKLVTAQQTRLRKCIAAATKK